MEQDFAYVKEKAVYPGAHSSKTNERVMSMDIL